MIELRDIEKRYGETRALCGIGLQVETGEFLSIMGSSGAGKSTLLNLIGGMDTPDRGTILIGGEDITAYTDEQLTLFRREQVGFVFQFFNLLPNLTVLENIQLPLLLNGIDEEAKAYEFTGRVGLKGKEHDYPYQLSGGEQQRVAIARALVHDPHIILADEPTGSLDSQTGKSIMELIREFSGDREKTFILVTHEDYIAGYADRIVKIMDGTFIS